MTDVKPVEDQDWFVPAVLVAVIGVLGLIIVIVLAAQASDAEEESIAGQFERWTSCLRAEGANVPLVETIRGGGFRVTVDGSLVEEGIDEAALGPALEACEEESPEGVQQLMSLIDGFSHGPFEMFGEFEMLEKFGEFEDFEEFDDFSGPRRPRVEREIEQMELAEICERIESGDIDPSSVPRRLLRACT